MLSLVVLASCSTASSGDAAAGQVPQISVMGYGTVYAVPEIAYINMGVRSTGDSVSDALELNNNQAQAIKDTLVSQGVEEKDIQTSSFSIYPQSDYDYQGSITRTYFSVENNVYVTVRDLQNLGVTLDAVAKSGANSIYGISFDVEDKTDEQTAARQLAVDSARTQAQELAAAAGKELGEILEISTVYNYPTSYYEYGLGGGGADYAYAGSVPIASGQIQIDVNVTMTFEIK